MPSQHSRRTRKPVHEKAHHGPGLLGILARSPAALAAAVRQAGLSDAEIMEVIGHVALHLTAASVGHAARLKLDFPPAPPLPASRTRSRVA